MTEMDNLVHKSSEFVYQKSEICCLGTQRTENLCTKVMEFTDLVHSCPSNDGKRRLSVRSPACYLDPRLIHSEGVVVFE